MTLDDQRMTDAGTSFGRDLGKLLTVITVVVTLNKYSLLFYPSMSKAYFPLIVPFRTLAADFGAFCAALLLALIRSRTGVSHAAYAVIAGLLLGLVYLIYDTLLIYRLDWRLIAAGTIITAVVSWASIAKQPRASGPTRPVILACVIAGDLLFALIAPTIVALIAFGP